MGWSHFASAMALALRCGSLRRSRVATAVLGKTHSKGGMLPMNCHGSGCRAAGRLSRLPGVFVCHADRTDALSNYLSAACLQLF
jgi:hypothetical protein